MADVIASARIAEQTVTNDLSLLGELCQDRHVAEPEGDLNEFAPTVERVFTRAVRPPALRRAAQCRQRATTAPPWRFGTTGTGLDAAPRPMDRGVASNIQGTADKCFPCGNLHAYFGNYCKVCQNVHFSQMTGQFRQM